MLVLNSLFYCIPIRQRQWTKRKLNEENSRAMRVKMQKRFFFVMISHFPTLGLAFVISFQRALLMAYEEFANIFVVMHFLYSFTLLFLVATRIYFLFYFSVFVGRRKVSSVTRYTHSIDSVLNNTNPYFSQICEMEKGHTWIEIHWQLHQKIEI